MPGRTGRGGSAASPASRAGPGRGAEGRFRAAPSGHAGGVFIFKRGGERTQVRFMPGCLLWSIVLSIVLTILLNVLIRAF